jgi:hypothetical protein
VTPDSSDSDPIRFWAYADRRGEQGRARVLRPLASNLTQREIGADVYLSLNTIKSNTRSIFRKLEARAASRRSLELPSSI